MTKHIRVENACTSNFKVTVEVWDKGQNGAPDVLVKEYKLDHPTAMTPQYECYITSSRYLVVKERAPDAD